MDNDNRNVCSICAKPVTAGDGIREFPGFVQLTSDPLYKFSDARMHDSCFAEHPLGAMALERFQRVKELYKPDIPITQRECSICLEPLGNVSFGVLAYYTDDRNNPLYELNCFRYHKRCVRHWDRLDELYKCLEDVCEFDNELVSQIKRSELKKMLESRKHS